MKNRAGTSPWINAAPKPTGEWPVGNVGRPGAWRPGAWPFICFPNLAHLLVTTAPPVVRFLRIHAIRARAVVDMRRVQVRCLPRNSQEEEVIVVAPLAQTQTVEQLLCDLRLPTGRNDLAWLCV